MKGAQHLKGVNLNGKGAKGFVYDLVRGGIQSPIGEKKGKQEKPILKTTITSTSGGENYPTGKKTGQ